MKLLRVDDQKDFKRSGGRTFKEILNYDFGSFSFDNCCIQVVRGHTINGFIDFHQHQHSYEIFIFPEGGLLIVNEQLIHFDPWDAILLEPGDKHGYEGNSKSNTSHIAIRIGPKNDKQS